MYHRWQPKYLQSPRKQVTTSIRKDLREQLKQYSIDIHQPETKIYDMLLETLFNNKSFQQEIINKVKNY